MQFYTSLFMNSVRKTPKPSLPPSMAQLKPAQKDLERQTLRIQALYVWSLRYLLVVLVVQFPVPTTLCTGSDHVDCGM